MQRANKHTSFGLVTVSLVLAGMLAGCGGGMRTPTIAINLTEAGYDTPDGMVNDKDGSVILSMLNLNQADKPAMLLRITCTDGKYSLTKITDLPDCPETGKGAAPLGVAVAEDGNLYVADNQTFVESEKKNVSRLLRVVMKDGKAVKVEPVVIGFQMSNAVSCHKGCVYVTETMIDAGNWPLTSGVYRFKISELQGAEPIKIKTDGTDEHIIAKLTTFNTEWAVGANGMGFTPCGCCLYVCNFGDGELLKFKLDPETGKAVSRTIVAQLDGMQSTDGMKVCPETGDIFIADFLANAIHKVCPKSGEVTTLAQNDLTDGKGGALDKPSEVCLFDGKVLVSNIDLNLHGNTSDAPQTISVIDLGCRCPLGCCKLFGR